MKAFRKTKVVLCIAVIMLIICLVGCNKKQAENTQTIQTSQENITIETENIEPVVKEPELVFKAGSDNIVLFAGQEWLLLDKQADKALLLSSEILEQRAYKSPNSATTWAESTLRTYLNNEYYDNKFNDSEKARIIETTLTNENNQWFGTNGGANTTDKVFLLSLAELVQYLGDSGQVAKRPAGDSPWIGDRFDSARKAQHNGTAIWWWLRSPGATSDVAAVINGTGNIGMGGLSVHFNNGGVRPALWIRI